MQMALFKVTHISVVEGPRGGESYVLTLECGCSVVRPIRKVNGNYMRAMELLNAPENFTAPNRCKCPTCSN